MGATETPALTVSGEQRRSAVYQHPRREQIEAMLRRGKSKDWIAAWLEEEYPLVVHDEKGLPTAEPHPEAHRNKRLRVQAPTIERYRARFMPECASGVDVVSGELESIIGRRLPPDVAKPELAVMETGIRVAEHNLTRSLAADRKMGFVQTTTLDANKAMMSAAKETAEMKGKLGVEGYDLAPERQEITTNNRHMSVELHGRIAADGSVSPGDPVRVGIAQDMLNRTPEETAALIHAAELEARKRAAEGVIEAGPSGAVEKEPAPDGEAQPGSA